MKQTLGIVLHVSASSFGDAAQIDRWHRERGFSRIGYHWVVLNGLRRPGSYDPALDGQLENGREEHQIGAHCLADGANGFTLGVCTIGNPGWTVDGPEYLTPGNWLSGRVVNRAYMTRKQHSALVELLADICRRRGLDPMGTYRHPRTGRSIHVISQHSDFDGGKPLCASINLGILRKQVREAMK